MKILIAGTGAIGAAVGVPLVESGVDVFFLARGAHLEAMQKGGLRIKGAEAVKVRAGDRAPEGETAEYVLVAVKAYQNEGAADAFASAVGPDTRVVSLQNGLGSEEYFVERFGAERVLGGTVYGGGEIEAPGVVRVDVPVKVIVGDFPRGAGERARQLVDLLPVKGEVSDHIERNLWEKMLANAVFNSLQVIHNCELREFLEGEKHEEAKAALDELDRVAQANGVTVRREMLDQPWIFCRKYPTFRSSTLQDHERGKPLETDAFNGAIVAAGKRAGIPTPVHEGIFRRLQKLGDRTGA